ncbi:benzoylformate decarboxylase [Actinomycetospora sp. NBRC 106375]|uniref:benzoylformate decarboxylase n=1 Tax=Actinomycetospora sp. NBRC 106375 TaxID=3032207 RepID=UPI0024A5991F|nr:benzoylformate decarboxylase [Actinomycetospora sp. NBRC 106375]GLZ44071.1 benzoylformate decarboxylase [Actinomycetospora sp. NBRC 106375]
MTTVREASLAVLRSHGITTIFGNPGSTELPMFRDFPDDFRYVLGLQEGVAVGMADGYAQGMGRAALVNLHSAAGVGHGLGNVFTAFRNRTPLVLVAGQQARSLLTGEPFLFAERPAEFPEPYVKFSREPARAEDVPAALARAIHVATTPPCGPVLLSVPVDDWDRPAEPVPPHRVAGSVAGDPDVLAEIAGRLAAARAPALVVGGEVDRDGAFGDVVALAERHRARVYVAPMSPRCGFPETHPLFGGFLPAAHDGIRAALDGHDLALVLGSPVFPFHTEGAAPGDTSVPDATELVQLTEDPAHAAWTPVGTSVVTGLRHGVRALLAGPVPADRAAPEPRERTPRVGADGDVITEELLLQTLADLRAADAVVVEEAPATRGPMHDHLPFDRPASFYTCASGGLGHGLPAAVGMALARSEDVVALIGDGSAMYGIPALWSAAQLGVPLTVLIVHNARYRALDQFAEHFGITKPVGTALPGLDFVALAAGQGVPGTRVEHPGDLEKALAEALASPGPVLLDVLVR